MYSNLHNILHRDAGAGVHDKQLLVRYELLDTPGDFHVRAAGFAGVRNEVTMIRKDDVVNLAPERQPSIAPGEGLKPKKANERLVGKNWLKNKPPTGSEVLRMGITDVYVPDYARQLIRMR